MKTTEIARVSSSQEFPRGDGQTSDDPVHAIIIMTIRYPGKGL